MTRLILHIGPPKCGSSSIQHFLQHQQSSEYWHVPAPLIEQFNQPDLTLDQPEFKNFIEKVDALLQKHDQVILTHEYFFECQQTIKNICHYTSAESISIVGYVRKPSKLLISAFNQWEFRNPSVSDKIKEVLAAHQMDPSLFLGIEGYLIAIILSDSQLQLKPHRWHKEFSNLTEGIDADRVQIQVNSLPSKNRPYDLIADFCKTSGLHQPTNTPEPKNTSFSELLIESFYQTSNEFKEQMGQHGHNHFLIRLSGEIGNITLTETAFIKSLCSYIDSQDLEQTNEFCQQYNIPFSELKPNQELNKSQILDIISQEFTARKHNSNTLNKYHHIIAEWAKHSFEVYLEKSRAKAKKKRLWNRLNPFKK